MATQNANSKPEEKPRNSLNVKKQPKIIEKKMNEMKDDEKKKFVTNAMMGSFKSQNEFITFKSRFAGMTEQQKEEWAKAKILKQFKLWRDRNKRKKDLLAKIEKMQPGKTSNVILLQELIDINISLKNQ